MTLLIAVRIACELSIRMNHIAQRSFAMSQGHQDTMRPRASDGLPAWLDIVQKEVGSLRFGVVQIIVHDSEVVQIERTERIRFADARSGRTRKPNSVEGAP